MFLVMMHQMSLLIDYFCYLVFMGQHSLHHNLLSLHTQVYELIEFNFMYF